MGSEMSDAESFRLVDLAFRAWRTRWNKRGMEEEMDGVRRMEDEETCREAALRIKHRWSAHSVDHDVMSYFSRAREDRLSDLTYVAPLTVDQFEGEGKGKEARRAGLHTFLEKLRGSQHGTRVSAGAIGERRECKKRLRKHR